MSGHPIGIFKILMIALSSCMICENSQAQSTDITWEQLRDVSFDEVFSENADAYYLKPTFGARVLQIENTEVAITGYVIPVDINLNYYVLSAFPFASCFFCGGAGPESVMDLQMKGDQTFKNDDRRRFCGTLRFNRNDIYGLPFVLENATPCP